MSPPSGLNIVIPMAGLGSRFSTAGYKLPKPLISVAGLPMIVQLLSNLKLHPDDVIYIGLQKTADNEHAILSTIKSLLPHMPIYQVLLDGPTRGAADTLHSVIRNMELQHLTRRTISLDCDTIYFCDILSEMRRLPEGSGGVFFFNDEGGNAIYSYIKFDERSKRIEEIREKVRISPHANTGAYGFSNASILSEYLEKLLEGPVPEKGEFYTSAVISAMIHQGQEFLAVRVRISDFACVGTPKQLRDYCQRVGFEEST